MAETEKIRFMGYNRDGEKVDVTISGVYERAIMEVESSLSTMDTLRYNHVFLKSDSNPFDKQKFKKIKLSLVTEGIFHDMQILMQGRAYVMNNEGTTIDTIKQGV